MTRRAALEDPEVLAHAQRTATLGPLFQQSVAEHVLGPPDHPFDGTTFDPGRDGKRLTRGLKLVLRALQSGGWWTLRELAAAAQISEPSASARVRDLRKPKFGAYQVRSRIRTPGGCWEYGLSGAPAVRR